MPTITELNEAAPDTPTFVLFLYSQGLINRAAVKRWVSRKTPRRRRVGGTSSSTAARFCMRSRTRQFSMR